MITPETLAELLITWEMADVYPEEPDPDAQHGFLADWLLKEYLGDCTKVNATCFRRVAEDALREAKWLLKQMEALK